MYPLQAQHAAVCMVWASFPQHQGELLLIDSPVAPLPFTKAPLEQFPPETADSWGSPSCALRLDTDRTMQPLLRFLWETLQMRAKRGFLGYFHL